MAKRTRALVLIVSLIALSACSGGSSPSGTARSCAGSKSASSAAVTVATWCSADGAILVNGRGYTLYALTADTSTRSACDSSCTGVWPPLAASGVPKLAPGVKKSLVGNITRANGSRQLTYAGHPLYTYLADTGPHLANGQGLKGFGGTWYVISATTGKLITKKLSTKKGGNGPGY